jgi:hypothetical protein
MVGIRVTWFCSVCSARDSTYQLALGTAPVKLDLPMGWISLDGLIMCGDHGKRIQLTMVPLHAQFDSVEFRGAA